MGENNVEEKVNLTKMTDDNNDQVDPGISDFKISKEDLVEFMKNRQHDMIEALEQRFTDVNGLVRILKSSAVEGLSNIDADMEARRNKFGVNFIPPVPPKGFWRLVWEAVWEDTTLRILIVAALISLVLGMVLEDPATGWIEGFAILVAVAVVSLVTAVNDWGKEKQFRQLKNKINDDKKIDVIRAGTDHQLQIADIVVGDICLLKYGDLIPADGVLLQASDMKVDESSLTGESDMVKKSCEKDPALLSGTHVMEGSCKYIVTAVGPNSQSGIIMMLLGHGQKQKSAETNDKTSEGDGLMENVELNDGAASKAAEKDDEDDDDGESKSILQSKLTKLAVSIGWCGVVAASVTTVILVLRFCIEQYAIKGDSWDNKHLISFLRAFIVGVTILVVAIPEGLPLAVTISLAYSVKKMLRDNNLVRHLNACETMGNATAICSDKTGTLTTNRMTVVESFIQGHHYKPIPTSGTLQQDYINLLCQAIALNSNYSSRIEAPSDGQGLPTQLGNKTECSLLGFILELGETYQSHRDEHPTDSFAHVYTFNSSRKSMSTVINQPDGGFRMFTKGASEMVLSKCTQIIGEGGKISEFSEEHKAAFIKDVIEPMASNGLRTICVAYRDFPQDKGLPSWDDEDGNVSNLTCLALFGIEDPVRPEVPDAIRQCQRSGITVRMVTGDNANTARSIAIKCGILDPAKDDFIVIEGKDFNRRIRDSSGNIQQHLIDELWPKIRVMARSSPEDKYILVKGIIDAGKGEVVAVTGDGTNDGPALKKADVGFAMGIQGTEVAKEASDIILTDDNFTSIVKAVMWGRNVYDSISKFIQFQLTVNLVAISIAVIGALAFTESPLTAIQLLWVNLIMDSFASLALATEQPTPELLERKPYGRDKPLVNRTMLRFILGHGFYQLFVLLFLCFYGHIMFDVEYGFGRGHSAEPTEHTTIMFNTFVLMQVFNEINARMVHGERNVFKNIFVNKLFSIIVVGTFVVQVLLVQFTGRAFMVKPLNVEQWMWCIFFGFSELIWMQIVLCVPKFTIPKSFSFGKNVEDDVDQSAAMGKVLWVRSLSRLQYQIRVVNAFRNNLDSHNRTMNVVSPAVFNSLVVPLTGTGVANLTKDQGENAHNSNSNATA